MELLRFLSAVLWLQSIDLLMHTTHPSKIKTSIDNRDAHIPYLVTNLLVVGRYCSPAADGTFSGIMPLRWTMLPPKIDEPEVVVVPLGLRQQHLQVSLSLFHRRSRCEAPPLCQAVDVCVHRESWCPASLHESNHTFARCHQSPAIRPRGKLGPCITT